MKTFISGTRDGEPWPEAGGTLTVGDAEGADLCANGYAEPVGEKPVKRAEKRPAKKTAEKRSS